MKDNEDFMLLIKTIIRLNEDFMLLIKTIIRLNDKIDTFEKRITELEDICCDRCDNEEDEDEILHLNSEQMEQLSEMVAKFIDDCKENK